MKRGGSKKPTNLKILHGNPGKRPIDRNEVKPNPLAPIMPNWLSDRAKAEWQSMAPKLERLGLLTEIDGAAFAAYCQAYGRWAFVETKLKDVDLVTTTESGYIQQSPYLSIANRSMDIMSKFLAKFGMSPSDRAGLIDPNAGERDSKFARTLSR